MLVRSRLMGCTIVTLLGVSLRWSLMPSAWPGLLIAKQAVAQTPSEVDREQRIIEGVYLNNQAWSLLGASGYDLPGALEKFQQALAIFRRSGAPAGEAVSLQGIGVVYLRQGNYPQAQEFLQQSLAVWQKLNEPDQVGYTLAYLGDVYTAQNQHSQALATYLKALPFYQQQGDRLSSSTRSRLLQSIAGSHFRQGEYQQALGYYQQILAIYDRGIERAQVLNNLGVVYINLGQYAQALAAYQAALDITVTVGNCYRTDPGPRLCFYGDEAAILNNLAAAYFNIGDYQRALDYAQRAAEINRKLRAGETPSSGTGRPAEPGELQLLKDTLGQNSRKLTMLNQDLTLRPSVGEFFNPDPERFGGDDPDVVTNVATNLNSLGQLYASAGRYGEAVQLYNQARTIFRDLKAPIGEGVVLNNLGNVYLSGGQYAEAITHYQLALKIYEEVGDRAGQANTLNNLGSAHRRQQATTNALEFYSQALNLYRQVGDRAGEATALSNLGQVHAAQKQYAAAEKHLSAAVQVFDGLRSQLKDTEKIALLDTQQATYNTLQQTLVAQNQPEKALEIAERGRARAFVELLAGRLQPLEGEVQNPTRAAQNVIQPITIAEIKQVAKDQNATLVEYGIISSNLLYIWVIKPTGEIVFQSVSLPSVQADDSGLSQLVENSRVEDLEVQGRGITFIERPSATARAATQIAAAETDTNLRQLHDLLIAPIAPHLPKNPADRVIIIPQGELFLVPFAALKDAQGQFLLANHTLVTAPSIQVLQFTRQQRSQTQAPCRGAGQTAGNCAISGEILIVGNPTMPKIGNPPQALSSLPGAETEARTIAEILKTQPLLGSQASKTAVVQRMTSVRLIHLATHGLLDDFKGLGVPGAIALAPDSNNSGQALAVPNGLLTASEILDLKLTADLVVLSACDTGRGRVTGDGVVGLARSLISAGVPSVVVSLWKVSDDSTSALMTHFYRNLQQPGTSKAAALRQAMLTTQQQYPDPKDWAAFTLMGEAE